MSENEVTPVIKTDTKYKFGVEWIKTGLALILEDIPMSEKLQKNIFKKTFPESDTPRFDYVDLAIDDLVYSDIRNSSNKNRPGILAVAAKKIREILSSKEKQIIERRLSEIEESSKKDKEAMTNQFFLTEERQMSDFYSVLAGVLGDSSSKEGLQNYKDSREKLLELISSNPNKPFLIVHGHGSQYYRQDKEWMIGEQNDRSRHTSLFNVLERMKVAENKYSVILISSCNEAEFTPPKTSNTPIFYSEGLSGAPNSIGYKHVNKII